MLCLAIESWANGLGRDYDKSHKGKSTQMAGCFDEKYKMLSSFDDLLFVRKTDIMC